jgi:hypothetical protein
LIEDLYSGRYELNRLLCVAKDWLLANAFLVEEEQP